MDKNKSAPYYKNNLDLDIARKLQSMNGDDIDDNDNIDNNDDGGNDDEGDD